MNGVDIGIGYSSNPASLIQNSGKFLSDNIRQIGANVQSTILELNTRKDLGNMVQNLQSLNVQSDQFPIQAAQVFASHPLAAKDERGQLALASLGKAHNEWRTMRDMTARFGNQQALAGIRNENAIGQIAARTQGQTVVEGLKQEGRKELLDIRNEDVLGQIEARASAEATKPITPYQQGQLDIRAKSEARMDKKAMADAIKTEITQLDRDINSAVSQYEKSMKREQDATTPEEKARHAADWSAVGKIADELKLKKAARLKSLQELEVAGEVLPPIGPDSVMPQPSSGKQEKVPVIDPNGVAGFLPANQVDAALQNGFKRR